MSFPAPAEPPISGAIKLGTIAKHRVKKFLIHGLNRKSRKPYKIECKENIKQKTRCATECKFKATKMHFNQVNNHMLIISANF